MCCQVKPPLALPQIGQAMACGLLRAVMEKRSASSLATRCQELYDTLPVCIGEVNLWLSPLNQYLRLSRPGSERYPDLTNTPWPDGQARMGC